MTPLMIRDLARFVTLTTLLGLGFVVGARSGPVPAHEARRVAVMKPLELTWYERPPVVDLSFEYAPYLTPDPTFRWEADGKARRKRFTDAELAAEYWLHDSFAERMNHINGELYLPAEERVETLHRFATHPHFSDAD